MESKLFQVPGPRWLMRPVEWAFGLDAFRIRHAAALALPESEPFLVRAMKATGLELAVAPEDAARIPSTGPLVVVANHPTGIVEGLSALSLVATVRPDVKALGTGLLSAIPELRPYCVAVSIFARHSAAAAANRRPVAEALDWLRAGHVLVVFPAGEVAHRSWRHFAVREGEWNSAAVRLAAKTGAALLPIAFPLRNRERFQLAGLVHPRLRTALLVREFLRHCDAPVPVAVGAPLAPGRVPPSLAGDSARLTAFLRLRVALLALRRSLAARPAPGGGSAAASRPDGAMVPDAPAVAADVAAAELLLAEGGFEVRLADPGHMAALLPEIGRLREESFRAVGEGTGAACDTDRFDALYLHLVLWDRVHGRLAGAYRLGDAATILAAHGVDGLYSHTLFEYGPALFGALPGEALEMGRSFIRAGYQRAYHPLYLLWKGIDALPARRPRLRVLFGPVSISASYPDAVRALMVEGLAAARGDPALVPLVRPRSPPAPFPRAPWRGSEVAPFLADFDALETLVKDLSPDGRGFPVLFRRYLRLGGRFAAFNLDPAFSGAIDGLVFVDLAAGGAARMKRFMDR